MEAKIFETVKRLTVEELGVKPEEVVPSARFLQELGVSLDVVELFMAVEEEFGIEIPDEDVGQAQSVGDLVDYIARKLGQTANASPGSSGSL